MVESLESELRRRLATTSTPGAVVAVLHDNALAVYPIGFSDPVKRHPIAAHVVFPLYSITKIYLAVLVLQLAEQGRLGLDVSARQYLTAPHLDARITMRHLLQHTAGLGDYGGLPAYHDALRQHPATPWTNEEYFAAALGDGLRYPPGEGWRYANVGYLLLRLIIEQVTGDPWGMVLTDQILAPLGQQRPRVLTTGADLLEVTPGFSQRGDAPHCAWEDVRSNYHPGWVSHGLLAATAADVAEMFAALFTTSRLLGPEARAEMLVKVLVPGASDDTMREAGYGLGVMLYKHLSKGYVVGHNGGGPGWNASAMHAVRGGAPPLTVVALANSDEGIAPALAFTALRHVAAESTTER